MQWKASLQQKCNVCSLPQTTDWGWVVSRIEGGESTGDSSDDREGEGPERPDDGDERAVEKRCRGSDIIARRKGLH
jgi:hypothetical protein